MTSTADDDGFMAMAARMGERGLGTTMPNPAVGAVIVRQDLDGCVVVARGWTQPGGRPHAETEAIARAGAAARGATAYVTLEPCAHHGRTPPCADALIAAGLARVVIGERDPDPRVSGRGVERLRAAGIAVVEGVGRVEAHWLHLGHALRVTQKRPFVLLKMAMTAAGDIPRGAAGKPLWATGPEARALGHLLRARTDAILVGAGTVIADDPELSCRLPGLAARSPIRVVLDPQLRSLAGSKLAACAGQVPLWVFAGEAAPAEARDELSGAGARLFSMPATGDIFAISVMLERLAAEGVTRLLVEGGPATWAAFVAAGLVDEAIVFRAGADATFDGDPAPAFAQLSGIAGPVALGLIASQPIGNDHYWTYRRQDA